MLLAVYPSYEEIVLESSMHPLPGGNDVAEFREILWDMIRFTLPPMILGLFIGQCMTKRALHPLAQVATAAARLTEQTLGERLPVTKCDAEIARLVEVFNAMAARLETSFSQVREFSLHASHELKTPLSILRCSIENSLHDTNNIQPAMREELASQLHEIERLARMVDDLGTLTKADAGQLALAREPLDFGELVHEMADDAEQLARPTSIRVTLEACEPVQILGDRHRLRQLLLNLADNAIKHNHSNGSVTISLNREADQVRLTVSNTGAGLSTELKDRVFERFYRGNANVSNIEGCGLGLSIAEWIVTAHSGKIQFHSAQDQLTTVTVLLPLVETALQR
jgi:signal transduction histidine kinase